MRQASISKTIENNPDKVVANGNDEVPGVVQSPNEPAKTVAIDSDVAGEAVRPPARQPIKPLTEPASTRLRNLMKKIFAHLPNDNDESARNEKTNNLILTSWKPKLVALILGASLANVFNILGHIIIYYAWCYDTEDYDDSPFMNDAAYSYN